MANFTADAERREDRSAPSHLSLSDLGGIDASISAVLETIVMPLAHPEVYTHIGIPLPRQVFKTAEI